MGRQLFPLTIALLLVFAASASGSRAQPVDAAAAPPADSNRAEGSSFQGWDGSAPWIVASPRPARPSPPTSGDTPDQAKPVDNANARNRVPMPQGLAIGPSGRALGAMRMLNRLKTEGDESAVMPPTAEPMNSEEEDYGSNSAQREADRSARAAFPPIPRPPPRGSGQ